LIRNKILRMATKYVAHFLQRPAPGALFPNEKDQRMNNGKIFAMRKIPKSTKARTPCSITSIGSTGGMLVFL
jgi:hypothetical protein